MSPASRPATPPPQAVAYVGLGANLGDRLAALRAAARRLDDLLGVAVEAASPVYETEAHVLPGQAPQADHLNAVLRLRTRLAPLDLLDALHAVERAAGRDPRAARWAPRPLDLDLLLYGDLARTAPRLTLPHPRLAERRFVLAPLADLAPTLVLPGGAATLADLLDATPDRARVERTALRLWPAPAAPTDTG
jgi:2-amino-4-hydroxy-6-hydroxymethyldihydropteridine diphosphokinase